MQKKFLKNTFFILLVITLLYASVQIAFAGGGTYSLNVVSDQLVPGNQIDIVVTVTDNTKPAPYPLVVNEEFELVAHKESAGEGCETTQKRTDQNGQFKGRCFSDQSGKFAFHLHPITRGDLPDSGSLVVSFQLDEPVKQPTPTPSPSPTPVATPVSSPKSSPRPSVTPKPSAVASPVLVPTPTPKPSVLPTSSPKPTVAASPTPDAKAESAMGGRTITKTAAGAMIIGGLTLAGAVFAIWNMRGK